MRPDDLRSLLLQRRHRIAALRGHDGQRLSNCSCGMSKVIPVRSAQGGVFGEPLTVFKDSIRLVVLNAFYSETQARAIAEVIDCVISMSTTIGDEAAIVFTSCFYRPLVTARTLRPHSCLGRTRSTCVVSPEATIPTLFARAGIDPESQFVVGKPRLRLHSAKPRRTASNFYQLQPRG